METKPEEDTSYEYWRENIMDERLDYCDSEEKYEMYLQWKNCANVDLVMKGENDMNEEITTWDLSIMDDDDNVIFEAFDFDSEEDAETAAIEYCEEEGINIDDFLIDISQPDIVY